MPGRAPKTWLKEAAVFLKVDARRVVGTETPQLWKPFHDLPSLRPTPPAPPLPTAGSAKKAPRPADLSQQASFADAFKNSPFANKIRAGPEGASKGAGAPAEASSSRRANTVNKRRNDMPKGSQGHRDFLSSQAARGSSEPGFTEKWAHAALMLMSCGHGNTHPTPSRFKVHPSAPAV